MAAATLRNAQEEADAPGDGIAGLAHLLVPSVDHLRSPEIMCVISRVVGDASDRPAAALSRPAAGEFLGAFLQQVVCADESALSGSHSRRSRLDVGLPGDGVEEAVDLLPDV